VSAVAIGRWPRHHGLWLLVQPHLPPAELAHDAMHLRRVQTWAIRLALAEGVDPDLAGAAALVHDLAAVPKDGPDRALGGERSAILAGDPLLAAGYAVDEIAAVVAAVATCSWSRGRPPADALGAVLQDADRLDAIGAIGIARVFACAQWMSRPARAGRFYHPDDPLAVAARPLDDRLNAVDHFRAKLLRLAEGMHTALARAEAQRRHAAMLVFLADLERDLA